MSPYVVSNRMPGDDDGPRWPWLAAGLAVVAVAVFIVKRRLK